LSNTVFSRTGVSGHHEFSAVEAEANPRAHTRTPRRRSKPGVVPPFKQSSHIRSIQQSREEIEDEPDELAVDEAPKPPRKPSSALTSLPRIGSDAADFQILDRKPGQDHPAKSGRKRANPVHVSDDDDELAEKSLKTPRGPTRATNKGTVSGLSRRGDLPQTKFTMANSLMINVLVRAANRHQSHRYLDCTSTETSPTVNSLPGLDVSRRPRFLRPAPDGGLCAFTEDGERPEGLKWLTIGSTTKKLCWNPESVDVKIEQSATGTTGGLMMIRFDKPSDALLVKDWVEKQVPGAIILELPRYFWDPATIVL